MRTRVASGLDRLLAEGSRVAGLPDGARIGLLCHAASVDARARHVLECLTGATAPLRPVRLFAPEHGLWGHEQDMEHVADACDPWTGLEVVSLYGSDPATLTPRAEHLAGLDAVVVDLQDVGSRYYTYVYTMGHVMEAAGRCDLPVVVLDRPNPIGGDRIEGPILHAGFESFVGRFPLPVRHGLTAGELARRFADREGIECDVRVVTMSGWARTMSARETGLPWVPPSPNMPRPLTALVYPGGCLIEGTNLSEGRGTTTPFELVGAPWLDGRALAETLRAADLGGVRFRPASFRPMFQKHAGQACGGVQICVTETSSFRPFAVYLHVIAACRAQAPDRFDWRREPYEFEAGRLAIDLLLGRKDLREALEGGMEVDEMRGMWRSELDAFRAESSAWHLYPHGGA